MHKLVFYISGHGFGHSVRIQEVMKSLHRRNPYLRLIVKTNVPRWLFDLNLDFLYTYEHFKTDVGVVQRDSLHMDREKSLKQYADFLRHFPVLINRELQYLHKMQCDLIVSDIPAIAFEIASKAGLPSIGIGNFGWDWIYADFVRDYPEYEYIIPSIREAYSRASMLLRLPFYGDMSAFSSIRDIPLITRLSTIDTGMFRQRLGIPEDRKIILFSFGGFDMNDIHADAMRKLDHCFFISFLKLPSHLPNTLTLPREHFFHEDLVKLADIVMTKPGYGIVSECIANNTPILYTSRGPFPEYDKLVEGMRKYAVSRFIPQEDFFGGNWQPHIDAVLSNTEKPQDIGIDGATVASEYIESLLA